MKKNSFFFFFFLFLPGILFSQQKCGFTDNLKYLIAKDPSLYERMSQVDTELQKPVENPYYKTAAIITLPVVVHVVYKLAAQNISDAQIQSEITALNRDYMRAAADTVNTPAVWKGIAGNPQIQFCMAKRDPNGNPTTGITRTSTNSVSFSLDNKVKYTAQGGEDAWNCDKYLNIWVCNIGGGTILGYAQFPGYPDETDGIVIHYKAFGTTGTAIAPNNKGRTSVHEVGHWLGLHHVWGDDQGDCTGTDLINDTPNQEAENYGCPAFPHTDSCTTTSPGVMFMNYMDYCDDDCMNMFTKGQLVRIANTFNGFRAPIKTSNACTPVGVDELTDPYQFNVSPNPNDGSFTVDVHFNGARDLGIIVYDLIGNKVFSQKYLKTTGGLYDMHLENQPEGIYFVQITTVSGIFTKRLAISK